MGRKSPFPSCFCQFYNETMLYNNTISKKCPFYVINFLTVHDKRKLPRAICSWKSERKLWLKFKLNQSIFLFSSFKSVTVNFSFLNLFLDTWIRNPDLDSEYGSGSRPKLNADPTGSGSETLQLRLTSSGFCWPGCCTVSWICRMRRLQPDSVLVGGATIQGWLRISLAE